MKINMFSVITVSDPQYPEPHRSNSCPKIYYPACYPFLKRFFVSISLNIDSVTTILMTKIKKSKIFCRILFT
jgi:hypothetical protein